MLIQERKVQILLPTLNNINISIQPHASYKFDLFIFEDKFQILIVFEKKILLILNQSQL